MTAAKNDQALMHHRAQRKRVTYANTYYNKLTKYKTPEKPIKHRLTSLLRSVTCFYIFAKLYYCHFACQPDIKKVNKKELIYSKMLLTIGILL